MTKVAKHVRKSDFCVHLRLPTIAGETEAQHQQITLDLIDAICTVKPSFLLPQLVIEVRQTVRGLVHNAVLRMCRAGIPAMQVHMLFPGHPELEDDESTHPVIYRYSDGQIVAQETEMTRDEGSGSEIMTHVMIAAFKKCKIDTTKYVEGRVIPKLVVVNSDLPVAVEL